jgi:hypothetical protein
MHSVLPLLSDDAGSEVEIEVTSRRWPLTLEGGAAVEKGEIGTRRNTVVDAESAMRRLPAARQLLVDRQRIGVGPNSRRNAHKRRVVDLEVCSGL